MPGTADRAGTPDPSELSRIRALEAAARQGWPAAVETVIPGGWVLRATPGLDRARSNHALTPCRRLEVPELGPAIAAVRAFAARHDIRPGIQITPLGLHEDLEHRLEAEGWQRRWPALVLCTPGGSPGPTDAPPAASPPPPSASGPRSPQAALRLSDHADSAWLRTWARCEPGRDVEAHARTVLGALTGRAHFARIGDAAVGIAVPGPGTLGLYCVAVDPAHRRRGLGRAITAGLIALHPDDTVFLQVEAENRAAVALYAGLGLTESHRYAHWVAPPA